VGVGPQGTSPRRARGTGEPVGARGWAQSVSADGEVVVAPGSHDFGVLHLLNYHHIFLNLILLENIGNMRVLTEKSSRFPVLFTS
jgi:hypothetical protein